jgi:hypothetical protein
MSLVEDWKNMCAGVVKFDSSHFYALLHEENGPIEIQEIFSQLDESEELNKRYQRFKSPKKTATNEVVLSLVKRDIEEKTKLCHILGDNELLAYLSNTKYSFIDNVQFKKLSREDIPSAWLMEFIGDHMIANHKRSDKVNGILEAYFGLTTDYNLVWFLAKPLYNVKFNPDYFFDVWNHSANYLVGHKEIYILNNA